MATYEAQVRISTEELTGDLRVNVLHVDDPGQLHDEARALEIATSVRDLYIAHKTGSPGFGIMEYTPSTYAMQEVRVYAAGELGPPMASLLTTTPGQAVGSQAPQVSVTTTFRAADRRRWGRVYLPWSSAEAITSDGSQRVTALVRDFAVAQFSAWQEDLQFVGLEHVIFSRVFGTAVGITLYACDDVFDVIRSRRWEQVLARSEAASPPD